jgi:glutaminyl-tRNA synthetase
MGAAITALRNTPGLRWVNPLEIKNAVESTLTDRFGAKGEAKPKGKVSFAFSCSALRPRACRPY